MSQKALPQSIPDGSFEFVGPKVDDYIQRAIARFGAEAVKDAVSRHTKPKRGRRPVRDWPELRDVFEADAHEWLCGGDPFSTRSDYSIAKGFADQNPGHSHPGTMKRIARKLKQKRRWFTLATAEAMSQSAYPHMQHVRALKALAEEFPEQRYWQSSLQRAEATIADYAARHGQPAPAEMPMHEVEAGARSWRRIVTKRGGVGLLALHHHDHDKTGSD